MALGQSLDQSKHPYYFGELSSTFAGRTPIFGVRIGVFKPN